MYRYSELQLTNQKMTRKLTEKEEQLQDIRQKVDSVSLELRKSEKAKREVIYDILQLDCDGFHNVFTIFLLHDVMHNAVYAASVCDVCVCIYDV